MQNQETTPDTIAFDQFNTKLGRASLMGALSGLTADSCRVMAYIVLVHKGTMNTDPRCGHYQHMIDHLKMREAFQAIAQLIAKNFGSFVMDDKRVTFDFAINPQKANAVRGIADFFVKAP